jgi:hypothetical protein
LLQYAFDGDVEFGTFISTRGRINYLNKINFLIILNFCVLISNLTKKTNLRGHWSFWFGHFSFYMKLSNEVFTVAKIGFPSYTRPQINEHTESVTMENLDWIFKLLFFGQSILFACFLIERFLRILLS